MDKICDKDIVYRNKLLEIEEAELSLKRLELRMDSEKVEHKKRMADLSGNLDKTKERLVAMQEDVKKYEKETLGKV